MFSKMRITKSTENCLEQIEKLKEELAQAEKGNKSGNTAKHQRGE